MLLFFNGGKEEIFPLEERILIPSPKVATYDLSPDMSVLPVCDTVCKAIQQDVYHFIVCNLAAPDMVGHTGNLKATIQACETTDKGIGQIIQQSLNNDYIVVITSDHGNAEEMLFPNTNNPKTSHTENKVPLNIVIPSKIYQQIDWNFLKTDQAGLADIAPTCLHLMNLSIPNEMTGNSLVKL